MISVILGSQTYHTDICSSVNFETSWLTAKTELLLVDHVQGLDINSLNPWWLDY